MDQAVLQKIAQLRQLASQQGKTFDVMRFTIDNVYARATLAQLLETEHADIRNMSGQVMEAMFPPAPSTVRIKTTSTV